MAIRIAIGSDVIFRQFVLECRYDLLVGVGGSDSTTIKNAAVQSKQVHTSETFDHVVMWIIVSPHHSQYPVYLDTSLDEIFYFGEFNFAQFFLEYKACSASVAASLLARQCRALGASSVSVRTSLPPCSAVLASAGSAFAASLPPCSAAAASQPSHARFFACAEPSYFQKRHCS